MKSNGKAVARAVFICSLLFIFACVTINIYFPAEKVESVAGDIVNEVRGQKEGVKDQPSKGDRSSLSGHLLLAVTPSPAWAEDATTVSNPTIRALKDRLKANYAQMRPYYAKGMLVEGGNGYVSIGNTGPLGLKEKRDLNSLVDAENSTRKQLYEEVAKALKIDAGQVGRIAEIFAREWQKSVR
ncbi:MAG: DUF1318 domain-containing protein [Thermodesulfobacteriota bacterium]